VNINTDTLMLQADNKFKIMREAKTWNAPSPKEEKILALETQIQKLWKEKKKPKQQEGGKKGEGKDGSKKKKKKKEGAKWMKVPPANADKDKPKTIKGKDYFWCAKHVKWARHITSTCQGKGLNKDPKTNQEPQPSSQMTAHLGLSWVLSTVKLSDSE